MKAIRIHALGGPEQLQFEETDDPKPLPHQVKIQIKAIGVNYADTMFTRGEYFSKPQFPSIPGMEAAGVISELGSEVRGFSIGQPVIAIGANAYAETMVASTRELFPIPVKLPFIEAAALSIQGLTAHHVLHLLGRMSPGEKVLVHAGAGGVGSLAIQLAKRQKASMVIATVSSDSKAAFAHACGADHVINYKNQNLVQEVKKVAPKGVDLILEMIGGTDSYQRNIACLAPFGRLIVYGAASRDVKGTMEPIALMAKNLSVSGYYLTPLLHQPQLCQPVLQELIQCMLQGELKVHVGSTFSLAHARKAHEMLLGRDYLGKLVLLPEE